LPSPKAASLAPQQRNIVLVGNPNTGKSVVFHALTGLYVDVSNYPGTTVDVTSGTRGNDLITDTPGVYGIGSFNDEERVTKEIALDADVIINVVNGVQLQRDLFLTFQLADLGIPMVVAVNMMDEVAARGIEIDMEGLEEALGVPVVPIIATKNQGIDTLAARMEEARVGRGDPDLVQGLAPETRARDVLALEEEEARREEIYVARRRRVDALYYRVVREPKAEDSWSSILSKLMLKPATGILILTGVIFLMYKFVGVFVAQTIVDFMEEVVMDGYFVPWVEGLMGRFVEADSFLGTILIGEFGLLTMTITYIFGLLLPLVLGFYFMLAILEDTGYLPRIATLLDRLLMNIGLNGKAVIPTILGFGCVTMATITTRILGSRREQIIATVLLALTIPCSAQLGVISAMLAPLGVGYFVFYIGVIFAVYVLVGTILHRFLPGKSTDLLIDLPTLRWPRLGNVWQKTWSKTSHFLQEATPLFAIGALAISVMDYTGFLTAVQGWLAPVTEGWLRLPRETATAFIMGIVRRDFGAAGLYNMNLTTVQTVISLTTITLFIPCIASVLIIWKERGWKEWLGITFGTFATAFFVGGIIARIL
jgi:ferrous iron transport protein B